MRRSDRWPLLTVGTLSLIAFALGARYLDAQSMWRDEVDAIRFAEAPLSDLIANYTRPGWNGPLYFSVLRVWITVAGQSAYAVRFFSLVSGVLCIPLTYCVGRRLLDRQTALFAAMLAASAPYLAWYNAEAKMYTWVTSLALLAVYALRRAFDGDGVHWWAAQIGATSLAAYSHILAALLIPVQAVAYLVWRPRSRRQWVGGLAGGALLVLPYLPLAWWQAPLLVQRRATGFSAVPLGRILATLVTGWSIGPYPPQDWLRALPKVMAGVAVWGLALAALLALSRRHDRGGWVRRSRAALSLAVWALFPGVVVGLISLWQPIFADRYLIWGAPAFYLLVSLGITSVARLRSGAKPVVLLLAVLLLSTNLLSSRAQLAAGHKADYRSVASFIANYRGPNGASSPQEQPNQLPVRQYLPLVLAGSANAGGDIPLILFQIPYARHAFDYYYLGPQYARAEGPFTNHRSADGTYLMSEGELSQALEEITAGYGSVWLVATEVEAWDQRRLTESWLNANMRLELTAHFAHIDVHRYARRDKP